MQQGLYLPDDYTPSVNDVLCGHGYRYHHGNHRFRQIIANNLSRYEAATSKMYKSIAVFEIYNEVTGAGDLQNTNPGSKFIRFDLRCNRWYCITRAASRKKIGQTIREMINQRQQNETSFLANLGLPQHPDLNPSEESQLVSTMQVGAEQPDTHMSSHWQQQTLESELRNPNLIEHRRQESEDVDLFSHSDLCQISDVSPRRFSDIGLVDLWIQEAQAWDSSSSSQVSDAAAESDDHARILKA